MTDVIRNPLMGGTRLFLNIVLTLLYGATAILVVASLALPFLMAKPVADGGLTGEDAAMITGLVVLMMALVAFFRLLRAIVLSAADGDPFNTANAKRLEWMGWLAFAAWVINVVMSVAEAMPDGFGGGFVVEGEWVADMINESIALVVPLTLFILSRVFRHGAAMREDLEGTV